MRDTSFGILARTFLAGFFESDLLPDNVNPRQALVGILAVIVTPTMWMSLQPISASHRHFVVWQQAIQRGTTAEIYAEIEVAYWGIELSFALYVMAMVAFMTLLVWDRLFPDRRDLAVLGTLPLSDRTLLGAKLAALVIVVGGFLLALSTPSALGMAVGARNGPVAWMPIRYLIAHVIVMPMAGLFVCFSVIALQTALGVFLQKRLLRAVSVVCQLISVVVALEMLVFSGPFSRWLAENALRLAGDPVALWLPPFWFLGLYETLLGTEHVVFHEMAAVAVLAFGTSAVAVMAAYVASYRSVVRRVLESAEPRIGVPGWLTRSVSWLLYGVLVRHPTQQAVVMFVAASVARNQRYKLLLALYIGVAFAFIIGGVLFTIRIGRELLWGTPTVLLLSVPLLLSFFALVGLRVLFAVPTELPANWIFRMSETNDTASYVSGVRKAMILLALPSLVVATLPVYWWLWGPTLGLGHTVFWLTLDLLLVELLLIGLRRIPFTCSYVPGKANMKLWWWLYLFVMIGYAYQTARVELWLLGDATRWMIGVAVLVVFVVVARLARQRYDRPAARLVFDDEQAPAVQTLHLMPPV